jgi:cyclophilin family peptidyl-prolyl cis-trans isomerase
VSQARPSRRTPAVAPVELEAQPPRGRQAWIALIVMAAIVAVALATGWLIGKALEPVVPPRLAGCATSPQIAPREYLGLQPMCITANEKLTATINTTQGPIVIALHPEVAPITVNNFVVLAVHGYYNGLTFWKSEDWVIQTGDPRGDGRGGPGYSLPDEPGNTPWSGGAVGMARVPGGLVNGSQFFIVKTTWPDPGPTAVYNRFGTVISGLATAQLIQTTDTVQSVTIQVS